MDNFTLQYLETALWSSIDEDGEPLDRNFDFNDWSREAYFRAKADCEAFQQAADGLIKLENVANPRLGSASELAGHDFWLTRCGHGAGFWDGDWSEPAATKLDELSKSAGHLDVYIGDDRKLYFA